LKTLPSSLQCELLGPNYTYPVIVDTNVSASQIDSLLGLDCIVRPYGIL